MKATAYIVESGREPDPEFTNTVKNAGFSTVEPYSGLNAVETRMAETPICFFLFPPTDEMEPLQKVVRQVRGCKRRNVRFLPLIYFCHDPSHELIQNCVAMGFDDVITLPQKAAQVGNRLKYQLRNQIVYFETPHYFGPDRRTGARAEPSLNFDKPPSTEHRRFELIRTEDGISITAKHAIAA